MRINKKSDLPKWFDIEKYSVFHNIGDNDLLNQLIVDGIIYPMAL
ncbi:hypothetical protein Xedl_03282 [Xenorhabdus eapokensis]|uniref:Uncharacterized protein n=1 Tax=Xenorhabdus eapokensis TaxID=1873482 RepID=A0A1Q5TJY4_9GAMM|nr:hypothetical protein Xedl_03282 [Xenorhabdus eapokensis]